MKNLTIRIDPELEQKIRLQADQKNITFSNYVRLLIEKAMVMESQFDLPSSTTSNDYSELNKRIAEMIAEILCHTRATITMDTRIKTDPHSFLIESQNNAQNYIKKFINRVRHGSAT
jgi:hypothetical protein